MVPKSLIIEIFAPESLLDEVFTQKSAYFQKDWLILIIKIFIKILNV